MKTRRIAILTEEKEVETGSCSLNIRTNELMLLLYCRYTICRNDLDVWNCALRRYSANMGYVAMTIHVKNSFGSPSTKQE